MCFPEPCCCDSLVTMGLLPLVAETGILEEPPDTGGPPVLDTGGGKVWVVPEGEEWDEGGT